VKTHLVVKRGLSRALVILAVGILGLSFAGLARHAEAQSQAPEIDATVLQRLKTLTEVLHIIRGNYVEEVDPAELIDSAIEGLLIDLDPHSNYLDAKRSAETNERYRGEYFGIGISFAIRDGFITVISPIEGSPSDRLGIRAGDRIVMIEGESARGISENEVFEKLRGPEGTKVHVTIERDGREEPLEIDIVREKIPLRSVPYSFMLEDNTGYVRMILFSANTGNELEAALARLEAQGMKRLVLDLRGNSGGLLEQAVEVTDKFLDHGKLVVSQKGRIAGSNGEHFAVDRDQHPRHPLIILVDHGSASASEIVAGAVQDWDRGLVVGQTSFGKGLVQRQFRLRDGSALFLTIARYYTPSGRLIQREFKDRASYYAEGHDDVDPNAAEDDSALAARPKFFTAGGRVVFGGGGITPDVTLKPRDLIDIEEAVEIAGLPFSFANAHIGKTGFTFPAGFERYLPAYEVDDATWRAFVDYAVKTEPELKRADIEVERATLSRSVKREIAGNLWGPSERYRVMLATDPVLAEAMKLFPQASDLLALDVGTTPGGKRKPFQERPTADN
jgi:carboxyl-terminal processing protease